MPPWAKRRPPVGLPPSAGFYDTIDYRKVIPFEAEPVSSMSMDIDVFCFVDQLLFEDGPAFEQTRLQKLEVFVAEAKSTKPKLCMAIGCLFALLPEVVEMLLTCSVGPRTHTWPQG